MNSPRFDLSFIGNPSACYPEDRMAEDAEALPDLCSMRFIYPEDRMAEDAEVLPDLCSMRFIYPEDRMAEDAEAQIALTLPSIAGLVSGLTDGQRLAVLASTAAKELLAFVDMYADPFGIELHGVAQVGAASLASQLSVAGGLIAVPYVFCAGCRGSSRA